MKLNHLGNSTLSVPEICLGTMTFGQQNTEAEAHAQLDYALERGVNFIDTAEMYPVPPKAETYTKCETIIGNWLAKQARDRVIVATKVAGFARGMDWLKPDATPTNIRAACEASLRRLRTDVIDLYQLHWPSRNTPLFGALEFNPVNERASASIAEQVETFATLVKQGKIRHYGLSNETPYGLMQWLRVADEQGVPRPVSVQNAYSLVNRAFEDGSAEISFREKIGLLAYSPLAFGTLSAKYADDANAVGRINIFGKNWSPRYSRALTEEAVAAYAKLARENGFTPAQLALAWMRRKPFLTSAIIGATSMAQLQENIDAFAISVNDDVAKKIDAIHQRLRNPAQ